MDQGPIIIISSLVLIFGPLFGAFAVSTVRAVRRNNAQPVRTVRVQIVNMNKVFGSDRSQTVSFRAEDGELLKISVTDDMAYCQMTKGMYGILTHRGWNYKDFVPTQPPVTAPFPPSK